MSVVIPTRNRPHLVLRAVRSALRQTFEPTEVIVVVDGPDPETASTVTAEGDPRVRVDVLQSSRGAGGARNAGVAAATGDLVAFLDDDDVWLPGKLRAQVDALRRCETPDAVVVATAAEVDQGDHVSVWPRRPPRPGERVAEYLFVRDRAGEGTLFTPTLLVPRQLAVRLPMPTHLRVHEEWDWLLDLERAGAQVLVVMEPLVQVDARPRRSSVSNAPDWRASLTWARARREDLGERGFSAFVLNDVARAAVLSRAPLRDYLEIGGAALAGRPRVRDLLRFAARPTVLRVRRGRVLP